MKGTTNIRANTPDQHVHQMPSAQEDFELLPWADPYIAMLVNRYVAETTPSKPRRIRSVNVVTSATESMIDRFAV